MLYKREPSGNFVKFEIVLELSDALARMVVYLYSNATDNLSIIFLT